MTDVKTITDAIELANESHEIGYQKGRNEILREVATLPSPWHVTRWRTDRDLWGRCEWCGFSEPVVTRTHPKNGCLWEKASEIPSVTMNEERV